jgi:hypothetical protein
MSERKQKIFFGSVSFILVLVSVLIASCFSYLDYYEVLQKQKLTICYYLKKPFIICKPFQSMDLLEVCSQAV